MNENILSSIPDCINNLRSYTKSSNSSFRPALSKAKMVKSGRGIFLQSKGFIDLKYFGRDVLDSTEGFIRAQIYLKNALYTADFEQVLSTLLSIDFLLEFLLGGMPFVPLLLINLTILLVMDDDHDLQDAIIAGFPSKYCDVTVVMYSSLLTAFSKTLLSVTSMDADTNLLDKYHRDVQQNLSVLKALQSARFTSSEEKTITKSSTFKRKLSQAERKRAGLSTKSAIVDQRPFDQAGFAVPSSQEEANDIADRVLAYLKKILHVR